MNSFDAVVCVATVAAMTIGFNAGLLRSAVTILGLSDRDADRGLGHVDDDRTTRAAWR